MRLIDRQIAEWQAAAEFYTAKFWTSHDEDRPQWMRLRDAAVSILEAMRDARDLFDTLVEDTNVAG